MPEPFKIQLALQGGGAKIYGLLAAMSTVEALQNEGVIKITRVAGTSAGAIVGSLFAAGVSMQQVTDALLGDTGRQLVASFAVPGKFRMGSRVFRGLPFWRTKTLEDTIEDFLRPLRVRTFSDIKARTGIDVVIMAADLANSQAVRLEGDAAITSALMDSAGLPFCFRTWSRMGTSPVHVDGGICENLPIGSLKADEAIFGKIVAFTFPFVRPGSPDNLVSFAQALLDTAMNNSMNRAKSAIEQTSIFEVPTTLGTFEFERARNLGRGAEFQLISERTDRFLRNLAGTGSDQEPIIENNPWTETNKTAVLMMENLGRVFNLQHARWSSKYLRCRCEVTIKQLIPKGRLHYGEPDVFNYSATIEALDHPISCMATAITHPSEIRNYLGRTKWEVRRADGTLITAIPVPARNPEDPAQWELLYFLDPTIGPHDGIITQTLYDEVYGLMDKLVKTGKDRLRFFPRRAAGQVGRIELIIHVPNEVPGIRMVPLEGDGRGRPMTESELTGVPGGFYGCGWVGENLIAEPCFGVDIVR